MRHRLPSLNALRAFEAAGRHGSFSDAAHELSVTPGAVSRQIALLEAHFACRLFTRQRHGMAPTEKGHHLLRAVSEAFDRIDAASVHLKGAQPTSRLSFRVYPTFATEWLVPRLGAFRAAHPEIDFRLTTSLQPVDFESDEADLGILQGPGDWPHLQSEQLFFPTFLPVCSPDLLRRGPPLLNPQDLKHHTLLYSSIQAPMWQAWLAKAGVAGIDPERGSLFENSSLSYRAAREGMGVVLGQRMFLADDLIAGRLVAPFDLSLASRQAYFLVCPRRRAQERAIMAFRTWLIAELAATEARIAASLPNLGSGR